MTGHTCVSQREKNINLGETVKLKMTWADPQPFGLLLNVIVKFQLIIDQHTLAFVSLQQGWPGHQGNQ